MQSHARVDTRLPGGLFQVWVPTGQAQLKGDVCSFQIRTTDALGRRAPTVAREGVGAGERLSQKRGQENQQLSSGGTLPSLPGQRPPFCLRIQAASRKRPGRLLEGGRAALRACPLPSPVHRAPRPLNRPGGACECSSSSCSAPGTEALRQGPGLGRLEGVGSKRPPGRRDSTRWKWWMSPWW